MNIEQFTDLVQPVLDTVFEHPMGESLTATLDREFPENGEVFKRIESACHAAIEAGWMCSQGGPGRRFGRVIDPSDRTHGLSVDVVDLENIVGPHHRHPKGEICMVMPLDDDARFDGQPRGWCVFEPGSEHRPTVQGGRALVLYMLPGGEIEFTESAK